MHTLKILMLAFIRCHNLVDIDADGDLDNLVFYDDKYADFYLNVGSASNPDYVLQPSSSNPLDSFVRYKYRFSSLDNTTICRL